MTNKEKRRACVFGAGKLGSFAIEILKEYDQKFFCDNDKNKVGMLVNGFLVRGFEELTRIYIEEGDIDIYIAGYVQDIYEQCIKNEIKITGVYSPKQYKMVSYREYCIQEKRFYCNDSFVRYSNEKENHIKPISQDL